MSAEVMFRQALAAHAAGDFGGAERRYRALGRLKSTKALHNLGTLYADTGRGDAAEAVFREALAIDPGFSPSRHSLGMLLLATGRYADGWPLYEARLEIPELNAPPLDLGCPRWAGEPLAGKRLLVVGEQGFGDQIMFARFFTRLAEANVRATYICSPRLAGLFPGSVAATRASVFPRGDTGFRSAPCPTGWA
jgi:tetratricopeptide (TPR) repeat protein